MDQKSTREFSTAVVNKMKKDLKNFDPKKITEMVERIERYVELIQMAQSVEKKQKKKSTSPKGKKKKDTPTDVVPGTPEASSEVAVAAA